MLKESEALTLRETQLATLEILRVVDRICRDEGLRYYPAFGTLIGVVRHGGFIPWDDDLDIMMPRPDYDCLLRYFEKYANSLMPLIALHNTESRKLPFLITRISDTSYREVGECGADVPELGAFIDIYPLDGIGNDIEVAEAKIKQVRQNTMSYYRAGCFNSYLMGEGPIRKLLKRLNSFRLGSPGKYEARTKEILSAYSFDDSKYCIIVWEPTYIRETAMFGETTDMPFEDMMVPVPKEYDRVLRMSYGDYMQLPPEEERIGHHMYSIERRNRN